MGNWASVGVLSQEWPNKPALVKKALYSAAAVKASLKKNGQINELEAFDKELAAAKHRDCHIIVSWSGDADIDLYVEEPGGTICSRLNPRTTAGGVYHGDQYSQGKLASGQMQETYVLPKGFSGDYKVIIRRMTGKVTSGKVKVAVTNHFNSDFTAGLEKFVNLDEKGAIVKFKLQNGRRADDLEKHTLETLVRKKTAIEKSVLAQQLSQNFSTAAASSFFGSRLANGDDDFGSFGGNAGNQFGNQFSPGIVGYQPNIQTFPTGTFLTVNHATTADRLYVLVSVSPFFSTITSVETFNILGNAQNAQGAGGGGGAAGGGGAGGGFGGGFGGGGGGGNF